MGRKPNWPPHPVQKPGTAEARTYHAGRWWTCGRWVAVPGKKGEASPEAKAEHARLIARWLVDPASAARPKDEYLLADLLDDWGESADGPKTPHAAAMFRQSAESLEPWAAVPAGAFRPADLLAWQSGLGERYARETVKQLRRPLVAYQWAEDSDRVPEGTAARLWAAVARRPLPGKPMVPRKPADAKAVSKVVRELRKTKPVMAALAEVHSLTGARVGDLLGLVAGDVQRAGVFRTPRGAALDLTKAKVWAAFVREHKTAGRGHERALVFGPKAQRVLAPLLRRTPPGERLFAVAGQRAGGQAYMVAVRTACRRAGVAHFSPRQLRQMAADRVERAFGLEHVAAYLGHAGKTVTQRHYLTLALGKAADVTRAVG